MFRAAQNTRYPRWKFNPKYYWHPKETTEILQCSAKHQKFSHISKKWPRNVSKITYSEKSPKSQRSSPQQICQGECFAPNHNLRHSNTSLRCESGGAKHSSYETTEAATNSFIKKSQSISTRTKIQFCNLSAETPVSASSFSSLLCHLTKVSKHRDRMVTATPFASDQIWASALSPNRKIKFFDLVSQNVWLCNF